MALNIPSCAGVLYFMYLVVNDCFPPEEIFQVFSSAEAHNWWFCKNSLFFVLHPSVFLLFLSLENRFHFVLEGLFYSYWMF